jgi:UDPglucose--hexose-1-phosphate uridylyltransferase
LPQLRKDPVVGRWVIIATERSRRPTNFAPAPAAPAADFCPFCPGHESKTPPAVHTVRLNGAAEGDDDWDVRVVPNKFPALQIEGDLDRRGEGLYDLMNGIGAHEVVIESPSHTHDLPDLPPAHIAAVLGAFRERLIDLHRDRRLRYVLIFKNFGERAGATLEHPHSQLIAMPIIPKNIDEELAGARRYFELKERCVFCDIVQQELAAQETSRVVSATDHFLAMEPFAPRFPFETWILPRQHAAAFQSIEDPAAMLELAAVLKDTLQRLNLALERPPYNIVLHTSPVHNGVADYYHWHLEITPKLTRVAGFEIGSGFYINPTPPEDAARFLREIAVDD